MRNSDLEDSLLFKVSLMDMEPVVRAGFEGFRKGQTIVIPGVKQQIVAFPKSLYPKNISEKNCKKNLTLNCEGLKLLLC